LLVQLFVEVHLVRGILRADRDSLDALGLQVLDDPMLIGNAARRRAEFDLDVEVLRRRLGAAASVCPEVERIIADKGDVRLAASAAAGAALAVAGWKERGASDGKYAEDASDGAHGDSSREESGGRY